MSCPGCGQSLPVAPLIKGHMVLPASCLARQITMVGTVWEIHLAGYFPLPLQQCRSLQTGSCLCSGSRTSRLGSQPALLSPMGSGPGEWAWLGPLVHFPGKCGSRVQ